MSVKESSSNVEQARQQEQQKQQQQQQQQQSKPADEVEQTKYPFVVRKKKGLGRGQANLAKRKPRPIETRYDLALVAQSAHSLSFRRGPDKGVTARLFIAMPIPTILGCDRAASWTVERISRFTSCVINVFGS